MTKIVYDDIFRLHEMTPGHPESPLRLNAAMHGIQAIKPTDTEIEFLKPEPAELREVCQIHEEKYIEEIRNKSDKGGGFFTLDTTSNRHTYMASLLAAGGGILAIDEITRGSANNVFVLCRPPGHHAEFNRAFGFCFMNNIAIAAKHILNEKKYGRVLIVDYDAHHGNGTQNAFYRSKEVLYIGLHQDGRTLFPGTGFVEEIGEGEGKGYTVNIPMMPSAGDKSFETAFEQIVQPVAESYKPDFVLVSTGFDGHHQDPLAGLGLTIKGIASLNNSLMKIAEMYADGRIAFFLEGGYNLEVIKRATQNLIEELAGIQVKEFSDKFHEKEKHKDYIKTTVKEIEEILIGTLF